MKIYCIERDVENDINCRRINSKYPHGVQLPPNVSATASIIKESLEGASIVIVAVPRFACPRSTPPPLRTFLHDAAIGVLTKALIKIQASRSTLFASTSAQEITKMIVMIGGPAIANEPAGNTPAGIISGGKTKTGFIR